MRPSQPITATDSTNLLSYPDEIMIDWGTIPVGTVASLYWPNINSSVVLQLAAQMYAAHQFTALDPNMLQCRVGSRVTYIPIPPGNGCSFAGLLTVDLPTSIHVGNDFDIAVRRITSKQVLRDQPPAQSGERLLRKRP